MTQPDLPKSPSVIPGFLILTVLITSAGGQTPFDRSMGPLIETHCLSCHSGAGPKGGLDLAELGGDVADRPGLARLLRVRDRLIAGDMPPPDRPRVDAAQLDGAIRWADRTLATRAVRLPPAPGRTTVRRLSRVEYERTVRDLFGVDVGDLTAAFPSDDLGYGFDNIGEALTFSTLHIEKYAGAAEEIARRTVNTENPNEPEVRAATVDDMESTLGDRSARGDVHVLYTNGEVTASFSLPRKGRYVFRVTTWAQQAGPEIAKARLSVGGRRLKAVEVKATSRRNGNVVEEIELDAGRHEFGVAFINDYYKKDHPDPARRDRNLIVHLIEVVGPVDAPRLSPGHRWLFAADPGKGAPEKRARPIVRALLRRAWRRPPSSSEVGRFARLIGGKVRGGRSFHEAVRLAVAGALVSPHFLFRIEPGGLGGRVGDHEPVDAWQIASRLSYFLWSSTPDEELARAAASGSLLRRSGLLAQARRMLRDPKASALATQFAGQWLEVNNLVDAMPDPDRFPMFDAELRRDLRLETVTFFEHLLRERRPIRELVGADYSFINERLARHYGIPGVEGDQLRKVAFPSGRRGGLLGHGSVHVVTSDPTRTSPVKRGKWVLENLLGTPPPPPPPGVDALDEQDIKDAATLREQLERHRRSRVCASCHARMDALGFALEGFDAVGRLRAGSGGAPVDTRGELPDGRSVDGMAGLRELVAGDPLFVRTVARKLFVYAIGRDLTDADALAVEVLAAGLPGDPSLEDLILGIIELDAFRRRSVTK